MLRTFLAVEPMTLAHFWVVLVFSWGCQEGTIESFEGMILWQLKLKRPPGRGVGWKGVATERQGRDMMHEWAVRGDMDETSTGRRRNARGCDGMQGGGLEDRTSEDIGRADGWKNDKEAGSRGGK